MNTLGPRLAGVLGAAFVLHSVASFGQTETVSTVQIAAGATQKYSLLSRDKPADVERAWVLFTGYDGRAHVGTLDRSPVFLGRGLLVDGRRLFLRDRSAVAVVDSPSTMPEMSVAFRSSEAYLAGAEAVIEDIRRQLPNARIYLVGASNGSISAVNLAARMGSRIAGVVILSGVFSDPMQAGIGGLAHRVVIFHHTRDACVPLNFTAAFRDRFAPVVVEDIGVHYPSTCGPYSAHHFHGQEAAVINLMYQWANGQAVPATLR